MQASTIMHELGHNLGLQHGGNEADNYKPNYWSIMNYLYQVYGLDANPAGMTAYQRWRMQNGDGTPANYCNLTNSPCGAPAQFIMNYSDGSGADLDENNLLETQNIGRGGSASAYADWNMNGVLTGTSLSIDLNQDTSYPGKKILKDYNDWGHLTLAFNRNANTNSGASQVANRLKPVIDPVRDDRQPTAQESSPPAAFFQALRHVH
jgi:hypothetical protein